jgi:hypothetical protein
MRVGYASVLIPIATGVAAGTWISMSDWGTLRASVLPALSVIAAGILVRLARGVPFSNPDQFEVEEARKIGAAFVQIARSLRALIFATLIAMLWLALSPTLAERLNPVIAPTWIGPYFEPFLSGTVGLLVAYAVWRMVEVVQGDVSLAITQSSLLEKATQRKAAKKYEERIAGATSSITGRHGFGRSLQ